MTFLHELAHVLEGSVQKADDRVRVTAQLIRTDDGFHVWSQNYRRPLEDIFAIQDEIAADVAEALGSSLLGQPQPDLHGVATTDVTAYDSYLKGLERQALFSYGALDEAEGHFNQALASDPDFVDARLALVRNFVLKFSTGLISREEAETQTAAELSRVREQQPDSALARALELTLQLQDFDPSRSITDVHGLVGELRGLLRALPTESVFHYVDTMLQLDRAREAYEFLVLLRPGITRYERSCRTSRHCSCSGGQSC